jgi:hypothetical protein
VVEATDFRELYDSTYRRQLDGARLGRVLVEREMSSDPVVVV